MVKTAKKIFFHHFHPKNISEKGSHAYVWPNLKKHDVVPKEAFWPFLPHFRALKRPELSENIFLVIFLQNIFLRRGHMLMFNQRGFSAANGAFWPFLAHFLAQLDQMSQNYFSWFWAHTISDEGLHVSTKFLKVVKTSYFEDFWDFENPPGAPVPAKTLPAPAPASTAHTKIAISWLRINIFSWFFRQNTRKEFFFSTRYHTMVFKSFFKKWIFSASLATFSKFVPQHSRKYHRKN